MELDKKAPWAIDGKYREITSIHHLAGAAGRAIPPGAGTHSVLIYIRTSLMTLPRLAAKTIIA